MARIGLNISVSGFSGQLLIRWVKASAPLVQVGRSTAFSFPYDAVYNILGLDPVVYIVQLWRSSDGVDLTQLIKDWSIDASKITVTNFVTYQYLTDRGWDNTTPTVTDGVWADPVANDSFLIDTRLDGIPQDDLQVVEAGYGPKLNSEYSLYPGGGIELLAGKVFDSGVSWFITASTIEEIPAAPVSSSANMFSDVEVLTADRDVYISDLDNLYNKLVIANWAGSVGELVFPDLALIPDGTHITFQTQKGSQNYLKLQFDAGDSARFLNQDVNVIYLAKCEKISFYFFGGACYVIDYDGRGQERGGVWVDYDSTRHTDLSNLILANESTGVLDGDDYPGIYAWLLTLPSGTVPLGTAVGQWSYDSGGSVYPNKRYYGIDTGAGTFRVPHLPGVVAKMATSAGAYEADSVGPISLEIRDGSGGSSTGTMLNTGFAGQDNPSSWLANGAAGAEKYIRTTGTETRVKSFGQIAYIIL
jgi:hypothetical protein